MKGIFITFEGGEGSGKSLQAKLLYEFLISAGKDCELTREPGGTPQSEEIRKLVLTGDIDRWGPLTEALLYMSSRSDHWERKIKPSLENDKIVICDRFQDSSTIYQGICKGVNIEILNSIFNEITKGIKPNRTFLIDIDPKIGIKRSISRKGNVETRFEKMNLSFHEKVRKGFLDLSKTDSRFVIIDGSKSIAEIQNIIQKDILNLFSL